tara:strand:- start:474 stop:1031 length:558 start_codon:yes stop_codon:yes gene_type:complete
MNTLSHTEKLKATPTKSIVGRKGVERLDLLLLLIESLDLNGSQSMLFTAKQLGQDNIIPNAVVLWKKRCLNPLRKNARRGQLSYKESEALIRLICSMSERIYPMLRQLLSTKEPSSINQKRWDSLNRRFNDLVEERFNTRRSAVKRLMNKDTVITLNRHMVFTLALASGPGGEARLRANINDKAS